MLKAAVLLSLLGIAFGENIACWTLEQINDQIYLDNDLNNDNAIDGPEMDRLLVNWGIVAGAQGVSLSDFANAWVAKYHDTHAVGHAFAANLDVDGDHYISYNDIGVMIHRYDANGNGMAEKDEFMTFLNAEHPTKGNGNHGCH